MITIVWVVFRAYRTQNGFPMYREIRHQTRQINRQKMRKCNFTGPETEINERSMDLQRQMLCYSIISSVNSRKYRIYNIFSSVYCNMENFIL